MEIKNKTIAITGGTSGIGLELVNALAQENKVVVIACSKKRILALKNRFTSLEGYVCDLSDPSSYESVADRVIKAHRCIDIFINNAAIQNTKTFIDHDFEYKNIGHEIAVNFTAICSLSYLLLPALLTSGKPSYIVNINSGLGLAPKTESAIYCATKAAMHSFSLSLNYQLEHTHTRVLQAFLPLVDTPMTEGRGRNKLSAHAAAVQIIKGIREEKGEHYIGKAHLLSLLLRIAPSIAHKIMKGM